MKNWHEIFDLSFQYQVMSLQTQALSKSGYVSMGTNDARNLRAFISGVAAGIDDLLIIAIVPVGQAAILGLVRKQDSDLTVISAE